MLKAVKAWAQHRPALLRTGRKVFAVRHEIRDVYDSALSSLAFTLTARAQTPCGFTLRTSYSHAHRSMRAGVFEAEETKVIEAQLDQSDEFVDVGANIGFYTCLAQRRGKHAIAIEPQAKNLRFLYANLLDNGYESAEVYPLGLAKRPGLATLYGASGTGASLIRGWAGQTSLFRSVIPVTTLDTLLGDRVAGKRLMIKIDVEGAEYPVLEGASRTLCLWPKPTWLVEICLSEYHPAGLNPHYADTFELFWRRGYEVRAADREGRLIEPEDVQRCISTRQCGSGVINYIFTAKS